MTKNLTKVLSAQLKKITSDLDCGNTDASEDELVEVIDFVNKVVRRDEPLSKYQAKYIKDVIDDPDAYDGMPFTRFYADCIGSGTPINWEDMI